MADQKKSIEFTFKVNETSLNSLKNAIRSITQDMDKLIQTAAGINRLGGAGSAPIVGGGGAISPQGVISEIKTNRMSGNALSGFFSETGGAAANAARQTRNAAEAMLADVRRIQSAGGIFARAAARDRAYTSSDLPPPLPLRPQPSIGRAWSTPVISSQTMFGQGGSVLGPIPGISYANYVAGGAGPMQWGTGEAGLYAAGLIPDSGGKTTWADRGGWKVVRSGLRLGTAGLAGLATAANVYTNEMMEGGGVFNTAGGWSGGLAPEAQQGSRWYMGVAAARGAMMESRMRSIAGGDLKFGYALHNLSNAQARGVGFESGGTALTAQLWQGTKDAAGKSIGKIPVVGSIFGGGGSGSIMSGLNQEAMENNMMKETLARIEEAQAANPYMNMALDRFSGSQGPRISAMRLGVVGGTGFVRDYPTAPIGSTPRLKKLWADIMDAETPLTGKDKYAHLEADLMEQGYSVGELSAAKQSLLAGGRQFAGANARRAMYAAGAGYGQFGGLMATSAQAGGGMRFALGSVGGGIDPYAGIRMGMGILGSGFDPTGTTTGLGLLGAMQIGGGFQNNSGDLNRVNRLLAGSELGTSIVSGKVDPYQMGRNFVSATNILGKGGGFYAADALSGMNLRQMADVIAGEKPTASMIAHGITAGDVQRQLGTSVSSVFERWKSNDRNDPMNNAIRAFKASGQELPEYLKGLDKDARAEATRNLGVFVGEQFKVGAEAGEGLLQIAGGLGSKAAAGRIGAALDPNSAEGRSAKAQADIARGLADEFGKHLDKVFKTIDSSSQDVKGLAKTGGNMTTTAREFIDALDSIISHIEGITGRPVRAGPPKPK